MYVVYMGSSNGKPRDLLVRSYVQLLSSVLGSRNQPEESLVNSRTYAFIGFLAMLSSQQANALTGIWPESVSFSDVGIATIPRRWKGACMQGKDFNNSNCNRKLIGAWYYKTSSQSKLTARGSNKHDTHTASTAGGNAVLNANYYGLAKGTARGIAIYKVCDGGQCRGSHVLAGFHNAVNDGVDILSVSFGFYAAFLNYTRDPVAIGAFHASQKGILLVYSVGNNGPDPLTLSNTAPWIFTVAATPLTDNSHQMLFWAMARQSRV